MLHTMTSILLSNKYGQAHLDHCTFERNAEAAHGMLLYLLIGLLEFPVYKSYICTMVSFMFQYNCRQIETKVTISVRQLQAEFLHVREQNYFDIAVGTYL